MGSFPFQPDAGLIIVKEHDACPFQHGHHLCERVRPRPYPRILPCVESFAMLHGTFLRGLPCVQPKRSRAARKCFPVMRIKSDATLILRIRPKMRSTCARNCSFWPQIWDDPAMPSHYHVQRALRALTSQCHGLLSTDRCGVCLEQGWALESGAVTEVRQGYVMPYAWI